MSCSNVVSPLDLQPQVSSHALCLFCTVQSSERVILEGMMSGYDLTVPHPHMAQAENWVC